MIELDFARSEPYTLGIELEFQVLDARGMDLAPRAPDILAALPRDQQARVAPEFMRSIIEVQTGICQDVDQAGADLAHTIHLVEDLAADAGCLLFASSLHPFAEPADQVVSERERYLRIMEELQYVGRQFITQGMHVHVGMPGADACIQVCDTMQHYLPVLLAISCSSPWFRGQDTGFSSFRTKLFEMLPLAGLAGFLGSWDNYVEELGLLAASGVIREFRDLWWDVRPSPPLGTVEVRACDMPARMSEILGLAALIQALARVLARGAVRPRQVSWQVLRYNKWQAARHGLRGRFLDRLGLLGGGGMDMRHAARALMDAVREAARDLGGAHWLERLDPLLEQGCSSSRQRRLYRGSKDFSSVIKTLHQDFWKDL